MRRVLAAVSAAMLLAACGGPTIHQSATGSVHPAGWGRPAPVSAYPHSLSFTATPTAVMYDSVTVSQIPARPFAAAGYTAGLFVTYPVIRSRWPHTHTVSIAIAARFHADCLDVEPGDAVPSQVVSWIRADRAAGFRTPCVYSSFFEFTHEIQPLIARAGIARGSIFEWDADFRGCNGQIDFGFDATQCTDKALGRNLDQSVVTLRFLSIAQPALRPPGPLPVCIHHRMSRTACSEGKVLLAKRERALQSTGLALSRTEANLTSHRCVRPYRREICRTEGHARRELAVRFAWFRAHAGSLQAAL